MENSALAPTPVSYDQSRKDKNKRKNLIAFVVIMILLVTNVFLLVKVLENDKKVHQQEKIIVSSRIEKDALLSELKLEKDHFERMKSENSALNKRLGERDNEIRAKISQIEKLINSGDEAQLKKAKEELNKLRKLNDQYIAQITLLKKENQTLSTENATLNENLTLEKTKMQDLEQENSNLSAKVALGAILKAQFFTAKPIRVKSSGKEVDATRASKAEKVKTCFTLMENKVAEKGNKTVYLRIIGPDGATISSTPETILYKGTALAYTLKQDVPYENKDTEACFYWVKGTAYAKGEYTAELYTGSSQIGVAKFMLK